MYKISKLSVIIVDEISNEKPWMLAYLDQRMKEATQVFDKPYGGIALIMLGDFDQQPPIGGSSLPNFSMKLMEQKHQQDHGIYYVNRTKQDTVEINSTLCRTGSHLFELASHLQFVSQHRCTTDPEHISNLNKMHLGLKITPKDLDLYKNLSTSDLKNLSDFLYGTIITTGN